MKDKRGVSPVLATLLLVVITVAIAVIIYAWTTMFTTMQTGRTGIIIAETVLTPTSKENRTRVYSDRYNYTIGIRVRNVGSVDLSVTEVYLNGTLVPQNATPTCWTELWQPACRWWKNGRDTLWWMPQEFISPGESATIYIVDAWLRKGYPCTVRVVTGQGAYTDIAFYPP